MHLLQRAEQTNVSGKWLWGYSSEEEFQAFHFLEEKSLAIKTLVWQ